MKTTDKLRAIGVTMWIMGGALSVESNPLVGGLTVASGLLFGTGLLIDTLDANSDGIWNREGFFYVARASWETGRNRVTRERKLDFFTYNLIRMVDGDQVLKQMAIKD